MGAGSLNLRCHQRARRFLVAVPEPNLGAGRKPPCQPIGSRIQVEKIDMQRAWQPIRDPRKMASIERECRIQTRRNHVDVGRGMNAVKWNQVEGSAGCVGVETKSLTRPVGIVDYIPVIRSRPR
jgi:hypothetical protein